MQQVLQSWVCQAHRYQRDDRDQISWTPYISHDGCFSAGVESWTYTIHVETLCRILEPLYITLSLSLVASSPVSTQFIWTRQPQVFATIQTENFRPLLSQFLLLFLTNLLNRHTHNWSQWLYNLPDQLPSVAFTFSPRTTETSTLMSFDIRQSLNCLRFPSRYITVSRTQLSKQYTGEETRPAEPCKFPSLGVQSFQSIEI